MSVRPVRRLQRLARLGWRPSPLPPAIATWLDGSDARLALQLAMFGESVGPGVLGLSGGRKTQSQLHARALRLASSAVHGIPRSTFARGSSHHFPSWESLPPAIAAVSAAAQASATPRQRACGNIGASGWAAQTGSLGHVTHRIAVRSSARALLKARRSLQPASLASLPATTRSSPDHADHPIRQQWKAGVREALGYSTTEPVADSRTASSLQEAASSSLQEAALSWTEAGASNREAWQTIWVLSRACASHGMEEEALVISRWATAMRGGIPAYEDVEAAAMALGSLSVKLPAPRHRGETRSQKLRDKRLHALATLDDDGLASMAPFSPVMDISGEFGLGSEAITRSSWPEGLPVPTPRVASRLHWVWELLAATRMAEQEAEAVRRVAAAAREAPISHAGKAADNCPVPGRMIALCARILLPATPNACTDDEVAWSRSMAMQMLQQWLDTAAPGSASALHLSNPPRPSIATKSPPQHHHDQAAAELTDSTTADLKNSNDAMDSETAHALLARGSAAAMEGTASALLGVGQTEMGMRVVRAQVAVAAASGSDSTKQRNGRSASDSGMPSSGLFARVLGAAGSTSTEGVSATLEAMFASGRVATVQVFREVTRALVESAEHDNVSGEPSVLEAMQRASEALGRQVPPSMLGWAAFYAAERGWWTQVAAIRAKTEEEFPGEWEKSSWAARIQTMTRSVRDSR